MAVIESNLESQLISGIESMAQFKNVGIAFIGNRQCKELKKPMLPEGLRSWVVIEEVLPIMSNETFEPQREIQKRSNKNMGEELMNMGLSCTSAVLAGAATTASAAATPVTGGASTLVTVITYSAAIASAAQCGISIGRVINEIIEPNRNEAYLDSSRWYQRTTAFLDGVAIAGAVVDVGQQTRLIVRMSRSTGKPIREILKGLNRADRKRLAREMAAWKKRADTPAKFKRLVRAGKFPKLFRREAVTAAMKEALLSNISATLTLVGSGYSGNINGLVVYIASD